MKRLFLMFALLLATGLSGGFAADASKAEEAEIAKALEQLKGLSDLHGGTAEDMNEFIKMVNTPELTALAKRLAAQMEASGEPVDQAAVNAYVRENITRKDVELLLGQKVTEQEFVNAISTEISPEKIDEMQNRMDMYLVQ